MQAKKCATMCKPYILEITRDIPLNEKKTLTNIDQNKRLDMEKEIIEFCNQPRSLDEIKEYTKLDTTRDAVRRHFINPLIRDGRLKYTHNYKCHYNQRYINSQVEVTPEMLINIQETADKLTPKRYEMILELCKEPKGIKEIEEYIGSSNAREYAKALVEQGKLKYTHPSVPSYSKQKYINAEIDYKTFTDDDIVDYCKEPRTKSEIEQHFNITKSMRKGCLQRLVEQGKICYTKDSEKLGKFDGNRRLVKK